jgi:hypothetical protein
LAASFCFSSTLLTAAQHREALRNHDVARLKQLLMQRLAWMDAAFEWDVLTNSAYWPLDYTALHWASTTDNAALLVALLDIVLKKSADVNTRTNNCVSLRYTSPP